LNIPECIIPSIEEAVGLRARPIVNGNRLTNTEDKRSSVASSGTRLNPPFALHLFPFHIGRNQSDCGNILAVNRGNNIEQQFIDHRLCNFYRPGVAGCLDFQENQAG
jgi:hypothetical protein